jgi:hypothetical protein
VQGFQGTDSNRRVVLQHYVPTTASVSRGKQAGRLQASLTRVLEQEDLALWRPDDPSAVLTQLWSNMPRIGGICSSVRRVHNGKDVLRPRVSATFRANCRRRRRALRALLRTFGEGLRRGESVGICTGGSPSNEETGSRANNVADAARCRLNRSRRIPHQIALAPFSTRTRMRIR